MKAPRKPTVTAVIVVGDQRPAPGAPSTTPAAPTQRADSTHLAWVRPVPFGLLPVAFQEVLRHRLPSWTVRRRGVVAGCSPGLFCPGAPVTRGQMAVFLSGVFGLSLYGP